MMLSTLMIGYALSSIALSMFVVYSVAKGLWIGNNSFRINFRILFPILIFVFFSLTYFWSIDKHLTIKGIGRMLALFIVPLAFSFIQKINKKELDFILNFFTKVNVCLGIFFILTSIHRYLSSGLILEFYYHDLVSDLDLNAIYVSAFYAISFFYLLVKKQKKLLEKISLVILLVLIVLLSSKVIIFCVILGVILCGVRRIKTMKINIHKSIMVLILGLGVFCFTTREIILRIKEESKTNIEEIFQEERFNKIYPWTGTSIRLLQLRILKEQIEQEHIFWKGFGLFASRVDLIKRHERFNTYKDFHYYNYHNTYAQTLSEAGILGLILLLIMLFLSFIQAIKSKSFLFLIFSIMIPIWFFTESVLWVQRGLYFFIVFYCLFNRVDFIQIKHVLEK